MCFFFFKQKTAYEVRISDWSSDVCSSDLFPRKGDTASGRRHNLRQRLRQNSEPACAHPAFRKFAKASHHFVDNGETIGRRTTMGLNRFSIRRRSAESRVGKEVVSTCSTRWSHVQ